MIGRTSLRRRLRDDESGATLVEFALISPVMLFMMMGVFDIGYAVFMKSVLDGVVQKAARDASLESGPSSLPAIDAKVRAQLLNINKNATVSIDRKSYFQFTDVKRAEILQDDNGDGECNPGETFEDENGNGDWDKDIGLDGIGGPKDIVLYTVSVAYNELFPFNDFFRSSTGKKIIGYKQETRAVYKRVPSGYETVKVPVYTTTLLAPKKLRLPIYKRVGTPEIRAKKVPVYKLSGGEKKIFELPIYETKKVELPGGGREVQVPQYTLERYTRKKIDNVAEMVNVTVPTYKNVVYTENGKQKLRRVFLKNVTIKRPNLDVITQVERGEKTLWRRVLTGYLTIKKPEFTMQRTLVGTKKVVRTLGVKRELVGYRTAYSLVGIKRQLVGYKTVMVPRSKRTLMGYESISKPYGFKKQFVRNDTLKIPVYKTSDASIKIKGLGNSRVLTASTVVKNQPYGEQTDVTTTTETCT